MIDTKIIGGQKDQQDAVDSPGTHLNKLNTFASIIVSQEDVNSITAFQGNLKSGGGRQVIETPEIRCNSSKERQQQQ